MAASDTLSPAWNQRLGHHKPATRTQVSSSLLRVETSAFGPGRKRVLSLAANILGDDGQWSAPAGRHEVGRRPEHALDVAARHRGADLSQSAARNALEAVHQLGQGDLGRVMHQEV